MSEFMENNSNLGKNKYDTYALPRITSEEHMHW